eukprot:129611_1
MDVYCIASPHLKSWILTLTLWVLLFMKLGCVAGADSYCHCSWCNSSSSSSSSSYSTGNYWDTDIILFVMVLVLLRMHHVDGELVFLCLLCYYMLLKCGYHHLGDIYHKHM